MLEQLLNALGNPIIAKLLTIPGIIFAFTLKGYSQAFVAKKLGDPTPEANGKLTMNPMAHIDLIGFLCLLIFQFGWHKPVPTNSRYYKNIKRDKTFQILSGPLGLIIGSFVLSFFGVLFFNFFGLVLNSNNEFAIKVLLFLACIFIFAAQYPLFLAVFYLLPLPGLDGYNLITNFLPYKFNKVLYNIEKYSMFIFLGFILIMEYTPLGAYLLLPADIIYDLFEKLWSSLLGIFF